MVGAWGWRKENSPGENFLTTGEHLLAFGQAKRSKKSVTNGVTAAQLVKACRLELTSQNEPFRVRTPFPWPDTKKRLNFLRRFYQW